MCGIVTYWNYGQKAVPVQRDTLIGMRDKMALRGPDGAGLWVSDDHRVGMGHRRLSIIELSQSGDQPMHTVDDRLSIVFNGEIYNYQALRQGLIEKGYQFQSGSDTEVLLHLYQEMGMELVHHLRGMFAFALFDSRRQGLFLARDPLGIKPLYYSDDGDVFRAASQVKALLADPAVSRRPEPAGHTGFFLWGSVPEPYTLYQAIRALPAGSSLWVDRNGSRPVQRYFDVGQVIQESVQAPTADQQMIRGALLDSVRHHLVADVPVGVFLSAGVDSGTLLALATEAASCPPETVTVTFPEYDGTNRDESPLAELVARTYGARHTTHQVTIEDFAVEYERLIAAMDQPSIDGVNTYFVSKAAKAAGWKVALSGVGGDEIFAGYESFTQIPRLVKRLGFTRFLPGLGKGMRLLTAPWLKQMTSPKYAGILEYGGTFGGAYLLRRGLFMPWELPTLLDVEMVREGWRELASIQRLDALAGPITHDKARIMALEMCWYMRNQLLRDTDWASMAHSLEVRVPLVDFYLLRSLAGIALSPNGLSKQQLGRAPKQPLPDQVLSRPKTGFSIPVQHWLLRQGETSPQDRGLRAWARKVYAEVGRA